MSQRGANTATDARPLRTVRRGRVCSPRALVLCAIIQHAPRGRGANCALWAYFQDLVYWSFRGPQSLPFRGSKGLIMRTKKNPPTRERRRAQRRKSGGNPLKVLLTWPACCQASSGKRSGNAFTCRSPIGRSGQRINRSFTTTKTRWRLLYRVTVKLVCGCLNISHASNRSRTKCRIFIASCGCLGKPILMNGSLGCAAGGVTFPAIVILEPVKSPLATNPAGLGILRCTRLSAVKAHPSLSADGGDTSTGRRFSRLPIFTERIRSMKSSVYGGQGSTGVQLGHAHGKQAGSRGSCHAKRKRGQLYGYEITSSTH